MSVPTERPTLVMIPGHLCDRSIYAEQFKAFWNQARIEIADVTQDETVQAMAARMLETVEGPLALMGLSMGGMVAMEAIALAPDRITGAALIATDPLPAREKEVGWRDGMIAEVRAAGSLAPYVSAFSSSFFRHDAATGATLLPQVERMMLATDIDVFLRQANALSTRRDMRTALRAYGGPLTVVVGAEDKVCPPMLHRKICDAASHATFTEIPACGHLATLEAPMAVIDAVGSWLAQVQTS